MDTAVVCHHSFTWRTDTLICQQEVLTGHQRELAVQFPWPSIIHELYSIICRVHRHHTSVPTPFRSRASLCFWFQTWFCGNNCMQTVTKQFQLFRESSYLLVVNFILLHVHVNVSLIILSAAKMYQSACGLKLVTYSLVLDFCFRGMISTLWNIS